MTAFVHGYARALPEYVLTREEAEARLREVFEELGEEGERVGQIFANAGIDRRYLARPPAFYLQERGLTARNGAYAEVAPALGEAAARGALEAAGVAASEVDVVIDTSCTGVLIPALDAYLVEALGLRRDVRRLPLTEVGCAAGATSVAVAAELVRARPSATVLCVSVEMPSLTLQLHDGSRANLVSSAIFGDGAAAAVVTGQAPEGPALEVLASRTILFEDSRDVMGFELGTEGFRIVLSQRIPRLVRKHLRDEVDAFLEAKGLGVADCGFAVVHPGGTKVLDNVRDCLGLKEADVACSRQVLRDYGNLSSASVHFVAQAMWEAGAIPSDRFGLMIAMGPGFTLEMLLLKSR